MAKSRADAKKKHKDMDSYVRTLEKQVNELKSNFNEAKYFLEIREKENYNLNWHINNLSSHLSNLEKSLTFKALRMYQGFVDSILPETSQLRASYNRVIKSGQAISGKDKNSMPRADEKAFWRKFFSKSDSVDILFVNHEESRTGAPRILFEIAKHFKSKNKIALLSKSKGSMSYDFNKEFDNILYPDEVYSYLPPKERAREVLLKVRPRMVYVNSVVSYEYALEANKLGIPVIFHIHEMEKGIRRSIGHDVEATFKFNRVANLYIAVSNSAYRVLVDKFECPKDKVIIINEFINGDEVNRRSLELSKAYIKNELSWDDEILILAIGSFDKRKGADLLVDAYKVLPKKVRDKLRFVWIGNYLNEENLKVHYADFLKRNKNFMLIGEKENPFPYLRAADVFVLPSREDPFPLVILEALSLGKSIVAFKEGGGAEEAIGDSGKIVQDMTSKALANSIVSLIREKNFREKYSLKAKRNCKKYESTIILKKIDSVVSSVLSKIPKVDSKRDISMFAEEPIIKEVKSTLNRDDKIVNEVVKKEEPDIFFIRGFPKSGTNWVNNILGLHPEIYCTGEFHLSELRANLNNWLSTDKSLLSRKQISQVAVSGFEEMAKNSILEAWKISGKQGVKWAGDRTPGELNTIPIAGKPCIFIMRDGRDVVVSWIYHLLRLSRSGQHEWKKSPEMRELAENFKKDSNYFFKHPEHLLRVEGYVKSFMSEWARLTKINLEVLKNIKLGKSKEKVLFLKYEDLHKDVESGRNEMYSFLGVNPSKALPLNSLTKAGFEKDNPESFYRHGAIGDWKRYFSDENKKWFKEIAGDLLIKLGYEKDNNW